MTLGCKHKGIRKSEFVAMTHDLLIYFFAKSLSILYKDYLKETVSVNLSDPPGEDYNARFNL